MLLIMKGITELENELSFVGVWFTSKDTERAYGVLHLNLEKGYYTLEYSKPREEVEVPIKLTKEDSVFPIIHGIANSGEKITLLDCLLLKRSDRSSETTRQYTFYTKTVLIGCHSDDKEPSYHCYSFDSPALVEWAGLSCFNLKFIDTEYYSNSFSYTWKQERPIVFQAKNDLIIEFSATSGRCRGHVTSPVLNLSQSIQIRFSYSASTPLNQLWQDYYSFIRFISFGYQSNLSQNTVKGILCKNCLCASNSNNITIYASQPNHKPSEVLFFDYLFTLKDINDQRHTLDAWNEKRSLFQPIIDLYLGTIFNPDLPYEVRFLNLVQALEIFHARFRSSNKQEYQARIEQFLNSIQIKNLETHKIHLKPKSYSNDKGIRPVHRLSDLYMSDFNMRFCTMDDKVLPYSYIDKIVSTRNYLTHYNPDLEAAVFSVSELLDSILCLQVVLEYHILKELGFSSDVLTRLIVKRKGEINLQKFKLKVINNVN